MKQLVQDFKTGDIKLVDVPPPACQPGCVLVRNACSLVSAGTERSTVEMAQASMLGKARKRPDLVRQVFDTVKREGVGATINKIRSRLDQWKELGYSTAGTVIEVGAGVTDLAVGDRVACAGQDYASHAEVVCVPQNLVAKIPEGMVFEHAAFTTLGAIALQGVRQADVRLGENVAVIGLGLVGQLAVQLLKAAGCRVFGHDLKPEAVALAGVEPGQPDSMDAVIITAATDSNEPIRLAGQLCRDRGRVVMVGVTGMEIPRDIFFRKELDFRLSRSYGPGRYDPSYEEHGLDYPIGYVRWTEQRNMEAFLQLRLNLAPLITHTFKIDDAPKAYELITSKERFVGVLLQYPVGATSPSRPVAARMPLPHTAVVLGVIGAGNYAQGVLLPQFKANPDVTLHTVCTATGVNAKKTQEKFGFAGCTTDWQSVIANRDINTILVATRHDLHATITAAALQAGKTVFCEKPLCLREDELDEILNTGNTRLMVGFNRRFAPFAKPLPGPLVMRYRVSVTPLPKDHWVNDPVTGGGRILGEVCHFVDFLHCMARARPVSVFAQTFGQDNVQIALRFADGSVGAIDYFSVADSSLAKEHFEMFGGGRHVIVDDFRDKGQAEEVRQFVAAVKAGTKMPIAFEEIIATTRATLAILKSVQTGQAAILPTVG
ncbi:MAG: Inositol 2-dehydrogenase/D-chiro-inositol 3-dehydrogenase [Verrucomicrobiae bacterium]|nr:Inositol 2-dehydrogenase/D-chiro-inositol 3-dehydrogenase [Verrucomicrobiae bacterium]